MKRIICFFLVMAISLSINAVPAAAQTEDYPNRTVRLIAPSSPGGGIDFVARVIAPRLSEIWKQQVLVENRPGGGGMIGTDIVAKASPDGYTFEIVTSDFAATPFLHEKIPYKTPDDFAPITIIGEAPLVLVAHPSVKIKTLKELIAAAKERPDEITYASAGVTTSGNLAMLLVQSMAGIKMLHVPYKGAGAANTAAVSGEVQFLLTSSGALLPHIRSGRVRPIAVTSGKRVSVLPDVPTLAESGLPGFDFSIWFGLLAPAKTPKSVIDKIHAGVVEALKVEGLATQLKNAGYELGGLEPAKFSSKIRDDMKRLQKVINDAGIKPES